MRVFEIARRLDTLPLLVTVLGTYWLVTTITVLAAPRASVKIFVPASDPLNNFPNIETEEGAPNYLILSDLALSWHQSFLDSSSSHDSIPIEEFVSFDEDYWTSISAAERQKILEQIGLVDEPTMAILPTEEILRRVNQALAHQVGLFEVVRNANGERFIFTGDEFIRWQADFRFALVPIEGATPLHCERAPNELECLP